MAFERNCFTAVMRQKKILPDYLSMLKKQQETSRRAELPMLTYIFDETYAADVRSACI